MGRSLAGAAIALLALSLTTPGSALAGCVDPGMRGSTGSDHLVMLRAAGAIEDAPTARPHHEPPKRDESSPEDCFGPSCSQRDELPASQTTSGSPRVAQWAILSVTPVTSPPLLVRRMDTDDAGRPILAAVMIFHPPRCRPLAS